VVTITTSAKGLLDGTTTVTIRAGKPPKVVRAQEVS
jgi:hypothetical protein